MGKRNESQETRALEPGLRHFRLEHLLREELASLFDSELDDPRLESIRITGAELSRDGSRVRVWYSANGTTEARAVQRALERASGFVRRRLCEALPLKRTPELVFRAVAAIAYSTDEET